MTAPLDLEAIKRRHTAVDQKLAGLIRPTGFDDSQCHRDRQDLISEVERLQDENAALKSQLNAIEPFADEARRAIEDARTLRAEVDRLKAETENQDRRIAQLRRDQEDAMDRADRLSGALGCEQASTRAAERAREDALDKLRQAQNAAENAYRERDAAWARLGGLR